MFVYDLIKAMEIIRDNISANAVQNKYTKLCQNLRQTYIENNPIDIDPPLDDLISTLKKLDFSSFTSGMNKLLEQYEFFDLVGEKGLEQLESIRDVSKFNPSKVVEDMDLKRDKVNQLIQTSNQYLELLNKLDIDKEFVIKNEHAIMQISFSETIPIDNVQDLQNWSKDWAIVFNQFGALNGSSAADIKFQSINKSSPLIFDVIVYNWLARSIGKTINVFLDGYDKYLDIKIKQMHASNDNTTNSKQISELHRNDAEEIKVNLIESACEQVKEEAKEAGFEENPEWASLHLAVKRLFKFFDKGGSTKIYYPLEIKDDENQDELSEEEKKINIQNKEKINEERKEALELFKNIDSIRKEIILKKSLPDIQDLLENGSPFFEESEE